jgi:hypothetical protein
MQALHDVQPAREVQAANVLEIYIYGDMYDQVMQWRVWWYLSNCLAPTKLNHADMSLLLRGRRKKRSPKLAMLACDACH